MSGHLTRFIILSLVFVLSLAGHGQTAADSLSIRLAKADNLHDSIMMLSEIYPGLPRSLQSEVLEGIFALALQSDDYNSANEALRQSAIYYATDDSMQRVLIGRAERLPDNQEKRSTLVYLNIIANAARVRALTGSEREAKLREALALYAKADTSDTYRHVENLFLLCSYLTTEGELLTNYLQKLQALIDNLPVSDVALKTLFYMQTAGVYQSNGMIDKAVETDRKLLDVLARFQEMHDDDSPLIANYDRRAYRAYYRLIRNYGALAPEEVDEYYSRIIPLIDRNPELAGRGDREKLTIYHMMAKKRYADVIPIIREQLGDSADTDEERLYLLDALMKAAETIGDRETPVNALEMSNDILERRIKDKASQSYKDLQIVYDVNDLRHTNDELLLTNQQIQINRHKEQLAYAVICMVVLGALIVIVFMLYRRSKQLTSNLTKSNDLITAERDALKRAQDDLIEADEKARVANRMKNDFISNMGHEIKTPLASIVEYSGLITDFADADRREYVKQFSDVISLNTDRLLTLVNDVLDLPSLENAKGSLHIINTSVRDICKAVMSDVRDRINPGVELIFTSDGEADVSITTDPHRVEQVLFNLLMNAAKFTVKGSVTLGYTLSDRHDKVTFAITDTGIGIPSGEEEAIFSRIGSHHAPAHDHTLGLYISRMLAEMLGGSLTVDKDYHGGARFIFTIPISWV